MFQYAALKGIANHKGYEYSIPGIDILSQRPFGFDIIRCFNISSTQSNQNYSWINERTFEFDSYFFDNCPDNVDIVGYFQSEKYFKHIEDYDKIRIEFLKNLNIGSDYYLATAHRRENVEDALILQTILDLFALADATVIFPASYRTQKNLVRFDLKLPTNVVMVDPIGYRDMLALMAGAKAVITDSGTVVEETAVLGVPSVQMRKATERPQTYDCKSSVKFGQ